jgi:hypothetical protein
MDPYWTDIKNEGQELNHGEIKEVPDNKLKV